MRNGLDNHQGSVSLGLESELSFQVNHEQGVTSNLTLEFFGQSFMILDFSLIVLDCSEDLTCDWLGGNLCDQS